MTSLHDSFSSTYESLLIFTCSQFLGDCYYWPSVSCCLFFCQALVFRVFMTEWCSYKWTDTKWNEAFNQKSSQLLSVNSVYDGCFVQAFATIMHTVTCFLWSLGRWGSLKWLLAYTSQYLPHKRTCLLWCNAVQCKYCIWRNIVKPLLVWPFYSTPSSRSESLVFVIR